jgi:hypothetical protein
MKSNKSLSTKQQSEIFQILKERFDKNMQRHIGIHWEKIQSKLEANPEKLWSLNQMECTDGEPDVIGFDHETNEYIFVDCAEESPKARRSFCYDNEALASRKENKPKNSAVGLATEMGIEILTEQQYYDLQKLGKFDTKTSSWLKSPAEIRKLGGAIFGDFRFGRVFIYHNGAESYYGSRGFRGLLKV